MAYVTVPKDLTHVKSKVVFGLREAPPGHIAVIGLRHPLREPYVPLSEYTALLLLVQTKLTFCG